MEDNNLIYRDPVGDPDLVQLQRLFLPRPQWHQRITGLGGNLWAVCVARRAERRGVAQRPRRLDNSRARQQPSTGRCKEKVASKNTREIFSKEDESLTSEFRCRSRNNSLPAIQFRGENYHEQVDWNAPCKFLYFWGVELLIIIANVDLSF